MTRKLTEVRYAATRIELTISFWAMIVLKLTNLLDWSWWLILWPVWMGLIFGIIRTLTEEK